MNISYIIPKLKNVNSNSKVDIETKEKDIEFGSDLYLRLKNKLYEYSYNRNLDTLLGKSIAKDNKYGWLYIWDDKGNLILMAGKDNKIIINNTIYSIQGKNNNLVEEIYKIVFDKIN